MFQQITPQNDIMGLRLNDSIFINKEEYQAVNTAVIEAAEEDLTLLNLFPIRQVRASSKFYPYTTLSDTGDAAITESPSDFPALKLDGTEATVRIPWKGISFELEKDDIENSRKLGGRLDTLYARKAGFKVQKLQDEALYSKSSAFGTLGIEGQATGAFSGTDWSTATTDVYDQVRQWILSIPVAYQGQNLRMILHNDQWGELFRGNWNNGTNNEQVSGGTFFNKIKNAWPQLVIVQSQWVTTSEGILFPFREDVAHRVVALSVRVIDWIPKSPMEITMAAVAKDVLIVPTGAAVVKATGI